VQENNTSGARATVYMFGLAVIALVAYYVDAEVNEIALWQAALAAAIPFFALVLATVKAWPKRSKVDDSDA
jgi:uncharacterized membrane protein